MGAKAKQKAILRRISRDLKRLEKTLSRVNAATVMAQRHAGKIRHMTRVKEHKTKPQAEVKTP